MVECENISRDVFKKFKGPIEWHCSDCKKVHIAWLLIFFLSAFSYTKIHDSQGGTGNGDYLLNSSLPVPPDS